LSAGRDSSFNAVFVYGGDLHQRNQRTRHDCDQWRTEGVGWGGVQPPPPAPEIPKISVESSIA